MSVAVSGCLNSASTGPGTIVVEFDNRGPTAHSPQLRIEDTSGIVADKRVSVPAKGTYEEEFDLEGRSVTFTIVYSRQADGNSIHHNQRHAFGSLSDCGAEPLRFVFEHSMTQTSRHQSFHSKPVTKGCE